MKKKIVAIMMMAVLALSTAACGADGETTAVAHRQAIQGEALLPQLSQTRINLWYGLTVSRQTVLQESLT